MREQLEKRLEQLKAELEAGEKLLADLNAKQLSLQQTLLRISGAIQVLQEVLAQEGNGATNPVPLAAVAGELPPPPRK